MTRTKIRTLYRGHGITIKTTKMVDGWKGSADIKPPLRTGIRSLSILGAKTAKRASELVLRGAKTYVDQYG